MNQDPIRKYFNWSMNFLIGNNPQAADLFLMENLDAIKMVAKHMLEETGYRTQEIYRGILMHDAGLTQLEPHSNLKGLSFTDSRDVAAHFSDFKGFGAQYGINHLLGKNGYVISYTPDIDEVLYHYKFMQLLPYRQIFRRGGFSVDNLENQRELIIMQPDQPFTNLLTTERFKQTALCQ